MSSIWSCCVLNVLMLLSSGSTQTIVGENALQQFYDSLKLLNIDGNIIDSKNPASDLKQYDECLTNEDKNLTGVQLLAKNNYPSQSFTVQTEDGYLLKLINIPQPGKPVAFMVPGILGSYDDYITPGPQRGLAYVVFDAGYDVWILNPRGNVYSRNHTTLSPEEDPFWNFSWHEMGIYDLPAGISYTLQATGQSKLFYIGYSEGTTSVYVLLSQKPEYNAKFYLVSALAPIAFVAHVKSYVARAFVPFRNSYVTIAQTLGTGEFLPRTNFTQAIKNVFCGTSVMADYFCSSFTFLFFGFDYEQLNMTSYCVESYHNPSGTSVKQLVHYLQEINSEKFEQYDYGRKENLVRYNSTSPPDYNISKITAPQALYYGKNDWLSSTQDVEKLSTLLPNVVEKFLVAYEKFNHVDFIWGKDVKTFLYDEVISVMARYKPT